MRHLLFAFACMGLSACQPNTSSTATTGWTHTDSVTEVGLTIQERQDASTFRLDCTKPDARLTLSANLSQVGLSNMAPPFAMIASGSTFPATLLPGSDAGPMFSVTLPVTPEGLTALRDATTVRISVNDGYAFAESDIDQAQEFEKFVTACSNLTGIATKP